MSDDINKIAKDIRASMIPFEQQLNQAITQRHIPSYREIDIARCARNISTRAEALAQLAPLISDEDEA